MLSSPVSSDADLQWGQSSLFIQGLSDLRLGGPCKLSLSSFHPPFPQPQGGALQRLLLEAWGAPRAPPQQVLKPPSLEHHEMTDTQRSASLGRVLGTFSVPPFSWGAWSLTSSPTCQACTQIFVFPAQGTVQSSVSQSPLLDCPLPLLPRVGFAQMPRGKAWPSASTLLSLLFAVLDCGCLRTSFKMS